MIIDMPSLSTQQRYFALTQTLIPRPIAWVLTENAGGDYNLAPFSFFNGLGSDPVSLMFSVGLQADGSEKDTLRNLRERKYFMLHIAAVEQLHPLNQTAANIPAGVSEVTANHISLTAFKGAAMPRVADAPIAFDCELDQIITVGNNQQSLVIGNINLLYVRDDVIGQDDKGRQKFFADKIDPLARLGASEYMTFGEIKSLARPN
jgi:flavin reductase (DIM6/NTAB) family NADH-FMN oxidoreductase RutF